MQQEGSLFRYMLGWVNLRVMKSKAKQDSPQTTCLSFGSQTQPGKGTKCFHFSQEQMQTSIFIRGQLSAENAQGNQQNCYYKVLGRLTASELTVEFKVKDNITTQQECKGKNTICT